MEKVKELFHINRKIYIINPKGGFSSNNENVSSHKYNTEHI